jgi:hypothetical protein
MVDEFDSAVRQREKGEIFNVDLPEYNWYYVILKTHDNKMEKVFTSIVINCGKQKK